MVLRVSGKNLDIGEALRGQIETRVDAVLARYFDGKYSGHVTVSKDGAGFRSDCVLHLPSGITLEATGMAGDAYASFDQTVARIEKRLRRYKDRLKAKVIGTASNRVDGVLHGSYTFFEAPSDSEGDDKEYHPVVIAESKVALDRLAVSEAVVQLDMTGAPVLVFQHAGTGRVNVVYRRQDGAIGWVDSPPDNA